MYSQSHLSWSFWKSHYQEATLDQAHHVCKLSSSWRCDRVGEPTRVRLTPLLGSNDNRSWANTAVATYILPCSLSSWKWSFNILIQPVVRMTNFLPIVLKNCFGFVVRSQRMCLKFVLFSVARPQKVRNPPICKELWICWLQILNSKSPGKRSFKAANSLLPRTASSVHQRQKHWRLLSCSHRHALRTTLMVWFLQQSQRRFGKHKLASVRNWLSVDVVLFQMNIACCLTLTFMRAWGNEIWQECVLF